ncbi:MAG: hypothetical protein ACEY3D_05800 [Rickettsia sp.]|uniref:hypothetical protein n=1 Tax=Rickettsia sp. TaxID=789 RepID=UPI00397CEC58
MDQFYLCHPVVKPRGDTVGFTGLRNNASSRKRGSSKTYKKLVFLGLFYQIYNVCINIKAIFSRFPLSRE